jgi:hypothetical protein
MPYTGRISTLNLPEVLQFCLRSGKAHGKAYKFCRIEGPPFGEIFTSPAPLLIDISRGPALCFADPQTIPIFNCKLPF